jgi:hypothetical protein
MTVCSIDLRVGGKDHLVFVTEDGTECSVRGTYLDIHARFIRARATEASTADGLDIPVHSSLRFGPSTAVKADHCRSS